MIRHDQCTEIDRPMAAKTRFDGLLPPDVCIVEASDAMWETGLLPEEKEYVAGAVQKRVREFTAGRNCARQALTHAGFQTRPILVGRGRAPVFPSGISGTITHTDNYCAAAVVKIGNVRSIGIDAELNTPLCEGIVDLIATGSERTMLNNLVSYGKINWAMLLFCMKEAFFKAYFQLRPEYLDFIETEVTIDPELHVYNIQILKPGLGTYFRKTKFVGTYSCDAQLICTAMAFPAT